MKYYRAGHINRLTDDRWTSCVTTWRPYTTRKDDEGDEPSGGETTWTNTGATRYGRGQHTQESQEDDKIAMRLPHNILMYLSYLILHSYSRLAVLTLHVLCCKTKCIYLYLTCSVDVTVAPLTIGVVVVGEGTPRHIGRHKARRAVGVYLAVRRERENTLEPHACEHS